MTGEGVCLPEAAKRDFEATLPTHPKIVRVWYDEMNKPPATTEFE
jgi:GMP synthase PP-ATPase subunit